MNTIKPRKWTTEWYELATTDDLEEVLKVLKASLKHPPGKSHLEARRRLQNRIEKIQKELDRRATSEIEWEEDMP